MSATKGDNVPPATAAVVQNPAEQAKFVQEAAVVEDDAANLDGGTDHAQSKKKKPDAGLANYFVSIAIFILCNTALMALASLHLRHQVGRLVHGPMCILSNWLWDHNALDEHSLRPARRPLCRLLPPQHHRHQAAVHGFGEQTGSVHRLSVHRQILPVIHLHVHRQNQWASNECRSAIGISQGNICPARERHRHCTYPMQTRMN